MDVDALAFETDERLGFRPVDWLSLGLRGDAVLGAEGAEVTFTNGGERGGQKSFAGMADARLIWTSPLEVYLGGGIGLGHMVSLQCTCQENYAAHGTAKPIVQASLGIRYKAGLVWPGLELRALHWGDLETRGSVASPVPIPPIGRTEAWMLLLTLSLGVSIE